VSGTEKKEVQMKARHPHALALTSAVRELPYELGEMPQVYEALAPLGGIGFLESREGTERFARYGMAAARPLLTLTGRGDRYILDGPKGQLDSGVVRDPLMLLRFLAPACAVHPDLHSYRYAGGFLGMIGYETSGMFERIPRAAMDDLGLPDYCFALPSVLVLKDAVRRRLTLVAYAPKVAPKGTNKVERDPRALLDEAGSLLAGLPPAPSAPEVPVPVPGRHAVSSFPEEGFLAAVRSARAMIADGEMIQVVLSRRWEVTSPPAPAQVYRALAALNPSPYHFYLDLPGGKLLGASPELLVRREGEYLTVRPIAGTRRRGRKRGAPDSIDETEDALLEKELLADPKERSEHTMLVDLGRNDLGRVSLPGSVGVTRRMGVDRYSHVMHLVSEVQSRLSPGKDAFDALRASFPAGTVSGAPKIRAMQAIAQLEPVVRGPYAGGVGYFDLRGDMDFCIVIRSVFYSGGRAFFQSGAGIVADSVPEREKEEVDAKARAMLRAFGACEGGA
jgi:anthranilate synthase component 1